MAGSTKKRIINGGQPKGKSFSKEDPWSFGTKRLSWSFSQCDTSSDCRWAFTKERLSETFWETILPKMQEFETMTLADIFVSAKNSNHAIDVNKLSKEAAKRLVELRIEAEAVHSLRLGGQLRLYGVLDNAVYNIIWHDDNHGDNDTCVCWSNLEHS